MRNEICPTHDEVMDKGVCGWCSTGRKNDQGKLRWELLPADALEEVVRVLSKGAEKYESRNWEKGISYGRVFGALMRHSWEWWRRRRNDPEWGLHHLAHGACCILFLLTFELRNIEDLDDRPYEQSN